MSSKKYDANIGTTRHARAIQQAYLPVLEDIGDRDEIKVDFGS